MVIDTTTPNLNIMEARPIVCKEYENHGEFKVTPSNHRFGKGCPKCNSSKGELLTGKLLTIQNINYVSQKTYPDCKGIYNKNLRFDFYLPDYNILIEYNGMQHYIAVEYWGGEIGITRAR